MMGQHVMCHRRPDRRRQRRRHPACQPLTPFQFRRISQLLPSTPRLSPPFFQRPRWMQVCVGARDRFRLLRKLSLPRASPDQYLKSAAPMGPISKERCSDRPPILCVMAASDDSLSLSLLDTSILDTRDVFACACVLDIGLPPQNVPKC